MSVSLDPRKAHAVHHKGDVLLILTWVNDERAMVLMPAHRLPGSPWFILCESAAYKYDNPQYLARQSAKAAQVLCMAETSSSAFRIADLIMNYLPDLIRMPSSPEPEKRSGRAYGEMHLKEGGKLIHSEVLTLDQPVPEYA